MCFLNVFFVRCCNLGEDGLYNFGLSFGIHLWVPLLTAGEVLMPLELSGALGTGSNNNKCVFERFLCAVLRFEGGRFVQF